MSLPPDVLRQLISSSSETVFMFLLDLDFGNGLPSRYVNNTHENETVDGQEYEARSFAIQLPMESDREGEQTMRVEIDDTPGDLIIRMRTFSINNIEGIDRPRATIRLIADISPENVITGPWTFSIGGCQNNGPGSLVLTLVFQDFLNLPFPKILFTPSNFPAVFQQGQVIQ